MSNNKKNFVYHGGILAITSIIVRIIGLFYRIPLANMLGDTGMGYYSSAFDIYALLLMISAFGMSTAMAKLISNEIALKRTGNIKVIFRGALIFSSLWGLVLSVLLFVFADELALWYGIPHSAMPLKALAPALFILSILSVFRGFFQGFKTMIPTALSQLVEQVFNAVFSILLAWLLLKNSLEYAAAGGTLATGIGALFALIFIAGLYYLAESGKKRPKPTKDMTYGRTFKILLLTLVPVVLSATIYNISNVIEMIFFSKGQVFNGIDESSISMLYGIFSVKYRTIIAVPIAMASVFAISSLPSLTASFAKGNNRAVRAKSNMAIKISMIISLPSVIGLTVLAQPVIYLFFRTKDNLEYASQILMIGAGTILFFTLGSITVTILQSIDKMMAPIYNAIIGMIVKVACLLVFVYYYNLSLYGVLISIYAFGIVSVVLNFISIKKVINLKIDYSNVLVKPLISSLIMGGLAAGTYYLVGTLTKVNTIAVISSIILSALLYAVLIIKLRVLNKRELASLGRLGQLAMRFM